MLAYAVRRLSSTLVTLLLASVLVFAILHLTPGSPADVLAGPDATPQVVAAITHKLGLDQPLYDQYWKWIHGVLTGNLGESYILSAPVSQLLLQGFYNTLELMVTAMTLALVLAGVLGVAAATVRNRFLQGFLAGFNTVSLAIPPFITGLILILLFAIKLHLVPSGGNVGFSTDPVESLRDVALPAITLALPVSGVIARFLQVSVQQVLQEDYARTAVTKGLSRRRVLLRHILPNALPPVITVTGIQVGQLIGGAVIVEAIFAWPGLGQLAVSALLNRDYLVVQDVLIYAISVFVLTQLLTDVAISALDPRVRNPT